MADQEGSDKENTPQKGQQQQQQQEQKQVQQQKKGKDEKGNDADAEEDSDYQAATVTRQQKHKEQKKQERDEAGERTARSRSSSRRARRQRIQDGIKNGKYMMTNSLEALEEADANGELHETHMFERIGPDSTSMDGPVTHARAMRGEIPMRGKNPNQPERMPEKKMSELEDADGLKLTIEANLDVEIELKASIRGDLTLSLYE